MHLLTEGRIRGMGVEAGCTLVVQIANPGKSERHIYSHCRVFKVPDLPDGFYEVSFADQVAFLQRRNACWSAGIPWESALNRNSFPMRRTSISG